MKHILWVIPEVHRSQVNPNSNYFRNCKQLSLLLITYTDHLMVFQKNMEVTQHHDEVDSIAKQVVSDDYTVR